MEYVHSLSVSTRSLNKQREFLLSKSKQILEDNMFRSFFPEITKKFQGDAEFILHHYLFYEVIWGSF